MQRRPIRRGGILSAGYDPERRQLDIEFDTHRIMRYEDVGQEVADRFLTSAAPASYFADEIDGEYPAHEVNSKEARSASPQKRCPRRIKAALWRRVNRPNLPFSLQPEDVQKHLPVFLHQDNRNAA